MPNQRQLWKPSTLLHGTATATGLNSNPGHRTITLQGEYASLLLVAVAAANVAKYFFFFFKALQIKYCFIERINAQNVFI